jgi:hypothetical protein
MSVIETDYLVIGAGASGMAFTDALIADSDFDVVMVDRRHTPGGHWNDAYPFVRLHQPSAFYGVNSLPLGNDQIDETGPNAGFYELATAPEICDYYRRVLEDQLLPSGQVRFVGLSDYVEDRSNGHRVVSRLTGEETTVRVRRKVVDATYVQPSIPSTHTPAFEADPDVRVIPPNDLVTLTDPGSGFTVMGAGKTAMDSCYWLLDNGVEPEAIRWIRPRDAWLLDRGYLQPLDLVTNAIEGLSLDLESAAQADNVADLFRRLEACGQLVRLDPDVEPTMYRGAILSAPERDRLREIENVVRLGRVRHIGTDTITLEEGSVSTDRNQVHVDCTASGLRPVPARSIFEPDRITLQSVRTGQTTFNAAISAYVEVTRDDDAEKNRLCPPNPYPSAATDWIPTTYTMASAQAAWFGESDLPGWLDRSRLDVASGMSNHLDDPRMQSAMNRMLENQGPALANLERLMVETGHRV